MKKMMTALAAFTLTAGLAACSSGDDTETATTAAAGDISGNWMIELDSAEFENDNREYLLADGTFECKSCNPPFSMAATGEWQDLDRPGADKGMIEVVDDRTVKSAYQFKGKDTGNSIWTVSEDGTTMKLDFTSMTGDETVNGSETYTRTGDAPDGAHAVSGQWSNNGPDSVDEAALRAMYNVEGDQFSFDGNNGSYTATLGGEPVAIEGNNSGMMVAVERMGENGYRETYSRDGETLSVTELTIDGDTMSGVSTDARDDSKVRWTATRK